MASSTRSGRQPSVAKKAAAAPRQRSSSRSSSSRSSSSRSPSPSAGRGIVAERHDLWTLCLALIVCHLVWHAPANRLVDSLLGIERLDLRQQPLGAIDAQPLVFLLPLVALAWHDMMHETSKRFLHAVPDKVLCYILRVAGGYGIVQVLAQDLGIKSGLNQRNLVQLPIVQFCLLWGGAYALTGRRSEGMIAALLYFVLQLNVSGGELSGVCFEEV
ncbi:hypothetical protein T484DRAFT_1969923 [Baffinella frigidus]|nr:hypothetical protein T484DRAFT_1969923 [Cryptophyta sp. CCMP2293]